MSGEEKGLVKFNNRPMVSYAAQALAPFCDTVTISCNRNFDDYQRILQSELVASQSKAALNASNTSAVISDCVENVAGPVAGILSFLSAIKITQDAQSEPAYCIVCSCDMPLVDAKEIEQLIESAVSQQAPVAHFKNSENVKKDFYFPVVIELKPALLACKDWIEAPSCNSKMHSVRNWLDAVGAGRIHRIESCSENPSLVFSSANSREDLHRLAVVYKTNSTR